MATAAAKRPPVQHRYGFAALKQLWIDAGGAPTLAPLMAAVALAESSGDPTAVHHNSNGTVDRGLWQINSSHGWGSSSLDPRASAKQAVIVYRSQGPKAWSAYNNGSFLRYLSPNRAGVSLGGLGSLGLHNPFTAPLPLEDPNNPQGPAGLDKAAGGLIDSFFEKAKEPAARALLYLTFTALAIAFLVLGGVRAFGGSLPRRTYTPPNLQDAGFPEGF